MDPNQQGYPTDQKGQPNYAYEGQPQYGQPQQQYGQPQQQHGQPPPQYGQPPPQYGQPQPIQYNNTTVQQNNMQYVQQPVQYGPSGVVVMQPQPMHTTIIQPGVVRPSNYLGLAIFTTLCCNIICGGIAIAFSCMSQSSADGGELEQARTYGKVALGLSIAAIVSGVVCIIIVIIYQVAFATSVYSAYGIGYG